MPRAAKPIRPSQGIQARLAASGLRCLQEFQRPGLAELLDADGGEDRRADPQQRLAAGQAQRHRRPVLPERRRRRRSSLWSAASTATTPRPQMDQARAGAGEAGADRLAILAAAFGIDPRLEQAPCAVARRNRPPSRRPGSRRRRSRDSPSRRPHPRCGRCAGRDSRSPRTSIRAPRSRAGSPLQMLSCRPRLAPCAGQTMWAARPFRRPAHRAARACGSDGARASARSRARPA